MATQRLILATLAGHSADAVSTLFDRWASCPDPDAVDRFCTELRDNGSSLPVVYFCEWIDRWLMGDLVPGSNPKEGRRFQAACFSADSARDWAARCGQQWSEQQWFAARLNEAADGWSTVADGRLAVVCIRDVIGGTTLDEEMKRSLDQCPGWLKCF